MIKSFGDEDTEKIWKGTRVKTLPPEIQEVARRKPRMIHHAQNIQNLLITPANRLEQLKGDLKTYHSIRFNNQWRIIFQWSNNNTFNLQIVDYHS